MNYFHCLMPVQLGMKLAINNENVSGYFRKKCYVISLHLCISHFQTDTHLDILEMDILENTL